MPRSALFQVHFSEGHHGVAVQSQILQLRMECIKCDRHGDILL
jgi:hypothetical protein